MPTSVRYGGQHQFRAAVDVGPLEPRAEGSAVEQFGHECGRLGDMLGEPPLPDLRRARRLLDHRERVRQHDLTGCDRGQLADLRGRGRRLPADEHQARYPRPGIAEAGSIRAT